MPGRAIRAKLLDNSQIVALVGDRITPEADQGNTYPLIAYSVNDATENYLDSTPQVINPQVHVTVVATNYSQAQTLAALVKASLNHQKWDTESIQVRGCVYKDTSEDMLGSAAKRWYYEVTQIFSLWVKL